MEQLSSVSALYWSEINSPFLNYAIVSDHVRRQITVICHVGAADNRLILHVFTSQLWEEQIAEADRLYICYVRTVSGPLKGDYWRISLECRN